MGKMRFWTGYTYDMNIYAGKDLNTGGKTLGERVVLQLCSTIRNPDVTLAFDRFFTSVNLIDNIDFPAVGTCISTRRNMPKFRSGAKLAKGEMVRFKGSYRTQQLPSA
ncbi:piggyBac transposable element-derived protein 4 [Trichonephila clavata]|uniref:PiggyBac transposable element-derived protein 4 n=1 Tax=Trichonephila clavata TaxID=2740835 RepID=A0A8X6I137_TRICU|nr:piggyBac transposable element-derived protein 4 [Trichonephila clavata]